MDTWELALALWTKQIVFRKEWALVQQILDRFQQAEAMILIDL